MASESVRLLAITDQPFRQVLEQVTGDPPNLVLVSQAIQRPPHSWIAVPPLPGDADLLVRRTSYVHGASVLSRHLSFVLASALPPRVVEALREAKTDLSDVAAMEGARKVDFSFGHAGTQEGIDEAILTGFASDGFDPSFVWRRYVGTIRGTPAFVVLEALPADWPTGARHAD